MLAIWREKLFVTPRTRAYRSGALFRSVQSGMVFAHSDDYLNLHFRYKYLCYGIYVERGTGREVFAGNNGDIGRSKRRRRRPWMYPAYMRSIDSIRDFLAESVGQQFINIVQDISLQ